MNESGECRNCWVQKIRFRVSLSLKEYQPNLGRARLLRFSPPTLLNRRVGDWRGKMFGKRGKVVCTMQVYRGIARNKDCTNVFNALY